MLKSNLPTGSPSGIRMQGTRDIVQVKDPYKKQWVDWMQTGVIELPSTITITTTTLEGKAVICQIGDYTQTTTFINGIAVFNMIFEMGTATITCDEFSVEVAVTETGGSYEGVLEEVVDLVLWDGSSLQNGASLNGSNLEYSVTAGKLAGRSLRYTVGNILNQNMGLSYSLYYGSNYLILTRVNMSGINGGNTWPTTYLTAGAIYTHSFETLVGNETVETVTDSMLNKFSVSLYNSSGYTLDITKIFTKIELI